MIPVGRRTGALILLFLCGACGGETTGPHGVTGFFRLTHLRGVPVPYADPLGCCVYESGSLELDEFDYTITTIARNKADTAHFSVFESGSFYKSGDSLHFTAETGNLIDFQLGHATLVNDTIRLSLGGEGPGEPDAFPAVFVKE
jgi:hypothetical protein